MRLVFHVPVTRARGHLSQSIPKGRYSCSRPCAGQSRPVAASLVLGPVPDPRSPTGFTTSNIVRGFSSAGLRGTPTAYPDLPARTYAGSEMSLVNAAHGRSDDTSAVHPTGDRPHGDRR